MFRSKLVPSFVAETKETIDEFECKITDIDYRVEDFRELASSRNEVERGVPYIEFIEKLLREKRYHIKWTVDASMALRVTGGVILEEDCKNFLYKWFMSHYKEFKAKLDEFDRIMCAAA